MFCTNCGNQISDDALFCPKCGQKAKNQMNGTEAAVQPNANFVNPAVNTNSVNAGKKKSTVPIVIASVFVGVIICFVVMIGGLFWLGSRSSNDVGTGAVVLSSPEPGEADDNVSSLDSVNELLGYIDQAEELVSKAYSDRKALSDTEEPPKERFRKEADIIANSLSALSDLRNQADAVGGIDANLENAKTEYFNMVYDSQKAFSEVWVFYADYFDLCEVILSRPQIEYYDAIADYYNDLSAWYESVKEGYSAIDSCPSCLEGEWKQYKDILDLNSSIIQKFKDAEKYGDFLRLFSARFMSNRYDILEELQYDEFQNCLSGESSFFQNQRNVSSKLAEEMHTYAELGEGERSGYEFEYIRTGKITLSFDTVDTIYPSLYNTYDAFLIIKTGCLSGNRKIVVEAEIPGLTQKYKESFTLDSAYKAIYIKPPALTGDLDLSSAKDAQINVTISEQDGTLIQAKTFPVTIKSKYDVEWYTDEYGVATQDNILCFLTPEASAISQLKRQAIEEISSMTGGQKESFPGYQELYSNHYVSTYIQVAGIMRALYEMGVRYNMDPFSISGSNQHILFPKDVLEQQSGLCIETSLVVASALQSAGMHAFLVLPPGHAQVAVEVWPGSGEYFLIETTALSSNSNNESIFIENANALFDYEVLGTGSIIYYSQEDWLDYLSIDGTYLIDCDDSSVLGLTPFSN